MKFRALQWVALMFLAAASGVEAQPRAVAIQLAPGYNAISTPFVSGGNTVAELFPAMPDGTMFYKFDPTNGYTINAYESGIQGWEFNDGFAGTLRPGEAAWLYVPVPVSLSLVGEHLVPPPRPVVRVPGYNFVGCPNTQACAFTDVLGFAPAPGDTVSVYNQTVPVLPGSNNVQLAASSKHEYTTNGWDSAPVFLPAHGAFVLLANVPRITIQPARLRVAAGKPAQFNAVAFGGTPSAYRWRFQGTVLPSQSATLVLPNVGSSNAGFYTVEAVFGAGVVVTSIAARLIVDVMPAIVRQPANVTVGLGKEAKFNVAATGTPPLFYQWQFEGNPRTPYVQDQTNFFIPAAQPADAGNFRVVVTNFAGAVTSELARLELLLPPQILVPPQNQLVGIGQTVTLGVQAVGTPPLQYQWFLNGNLLLDETNATLTVTNAQPQDSGSYRVRVFNVAGGAESPPAFVQVDAPNFVFADNFGGGAVLNGLSGTVRGSNLGATIEGVEPRIFCKRGGHSVWTSYVPPATGIVTFRTRGSAIDTLLGAFTGSSVGTLTELAADDDSGGFLTSVMSMNVRQGEPVSIGIDGFAGAEGQIILSWQLERTTDLLPVIITQPKSLTVGRGAAATFNVQSQAGVPVIYQWFFNGQPIGGVAQPSLTVNNVQLNRVGQYFVRLSLGNRFLDSRSADLEINLPDAGPPVPNARSQDKFMDLVDTVNGTGCPDGFAPAAAPLLGLGYTGSHAFNSHGSGGQNGEPLVCGASGGASRWFAYIAPASGQLFINTDGSSFNTLLAVYTGCCDLENLTMVACDNNSGTNGLTSSLSLAAASGGVYFIAVDGVGGARGAVNLNYRLFTPMVLTNMARTTNSLTFKLNPTPSYPFTVQRTTNFVDWAGVLTTNVTTTSFSFTDTNLPSPRRFFYRGMRHP